MVLKNDSELVCTTRFDHNYSEPLKFDASDCDQVSEETTFALLLLSLLVKVTSVLRYYEGDCS